MPLGVAYALWEGIGSVLITLVCVTWLGESIGLRKRWVGLASIVCVLAAFTALAQAVKDIPLSMAWALFGQRLAGRGWLGLLLLLGGMGLLKLA